MKDFIVLIPCFNCEKTIDVVIKQCLSYVERVIVIDDGSKDRSAEFAKKSGAFLIQNQNNRGVGASLRSGFSLALKEGYCNVITIDADLAHNPNDIPKLIETHVTEKNSLTIGNRWQLYSSPYLPSCKCIHRSMSHSKTGASRTP